MNSFSNNPHHDSNTLISWKDQVINVLPIVIFIVTVFQFIPALKYFDASIYNNQSIELVSGSINTLWEKIFVFNSFAVIITNFTGLIGFNLQKKWAFSIILLGSLLSLVNAVLMFNVISIIATLLWVLLLLHIKKEFV